MSARSTSESTLPPKWRAEFDGYHRMLARGLLLIVHPCHRDPRVYRWKVTRAGRYVGRSHIDPKAPGVPLDDAKREALSMAAGIVDDDGDFWEAAKIAHRSAVSS